MLFFIKITSSYSDFAGRLYGPFDTKKAAAGALRKQGWMENINGEEGNWYARIERYAGINARIEQIELRKPAGLPPMKFFRME